MKNGQMSDDEAFEALADWTVRREEADKALKKIPFFANLAKFESAVRRTRVERSQAFMTDAEIRGRLLEHLYGLRHNNGGWVPINDVIFAGGEPIRWDAIVGVCGQLADVRLIEWKPLRAAEGIIAVNAKITGQGVAAVEAGYSPEIEVLFPSKNMTAPSAPSKLGELPIADAALAEIQDAVNTIKTELAVLSLSNSEKGEIIADLKQIEAEVERPAPRRTFMKLYLESLRDNLAKAAGAATAGGAVALAALVGSLIAKHFGIF